MLFEGVLHLDARKSFFNYLSQAVGSTATGIERSTLAGLPLAPRPERELLAVDLEIAQTYARFAHLNPFKRLFRSRTRVGHVAIGSDAVDLRALAGTEYDQGFLRPFDLRYPARIVPHVAPDVITICHFIKGRRDGDFTAAEREVLLRIAPQLSNFYRLDHHLNSLTLARDSAWQTLDALSIGVVLLGPDGRVRFATPPRSSLPGVGTGCGFPAAVFPPWMRPLPAHCASASRRFGAPCTPSMARHRKAAPSPFAGRRARARIARRYWRWVVLPISLPAPRSA
jgi:hypothetical protein